MQYPQMPMAGSSQMSTNEVFLRPNQEQYQRYMQMHNAQQLSQQHLPQLQQPGYYQNKPKGQRIRMQSSSEEEREDVSKPMANSKKCHKEENMHNSNEAT
jgi:hypothetical protein